MTVEEFLKILQSSGIEFRYGVFKKSAKRPFGIFMEEEPEKVFADGITAIQLKSFRIELYNDKKDPTVEQQLENALTNAGISFSRLDDIYLENEGLHEAVYEV